MQELNLTIAFIAGLVSFLSPCILPIIPGFLAYLAGGATAEAQPSRKEIFLNSLFFVIGFSVVFAVLGVLLNTILSYAAYDVQVWLGRIGGIVIIVFGLYLTKLIKIPWLDREHKLNIKTKGGSRYVTSFLFGLAFAAGWTPCVGAALGAILALAATQPSAAFWLLFAYAIGLGVPFLLVGAFTAQASKLIARLGKALYYINIIFGIILIILGVLVFTGTLNLIANFGFVNNIIQGS